MKEAHSSRKSFGQIFGLTFKVYFKGFWQHFGTGLLIILATGIFAMPLIVATFPIIKFTSYPIIQFPSNEIIVYALSYGLLVLASAVASSLYAGYFGPVTLDYLEQTQRKLGERYAIMFRSLGRILSVQIIISVIVMVIYLLFNYKLLAIYTSGDIMQLPAMGEDVNRMISNMSWLGALSTLITGFYMVFSRQIALFENLRWFSAIGKSAKTIVSGNFWSTMGYYIVFGLVMYVASFVIVLVVALVLVMAGMGILTSSADLSAIALGQMDLPILIKASLAISTIIIVAAAVVFQGLLSVFGMLVYFNDRTKSEQIPFPQVQTEEEQTT